MFDSKAAEGLGYYVYALFHPDVPRCPFYIGKGHGNRVFIHANGELPDKEVSTEPLSPKAEVIAAIKRSNKTVIHKIIRFGLSEEEAISVEAALIDLVNHIEPETLKNRVSGHGVAEGMIDARDLATALGATQLETKLPVLLIKIEQQWTQLLTQHQAAHAVPLPAIYEAVRGCWKISIYRATRAACILAVSRGLVRAAFTAEKWEVVGSKGRKRFEGIVAPVPYSQFVGQSVTDHFRRGGQNPVRYLNC